MADGDEALRPEEEEVGGGAVKSFLEHLEDLRWMLIKACGALFVAFVVCLFIPNQLVAILKWPLDKSSQRHVALVPTDTNQVLAVQMGDLTLVTGRTKTNHFGPVDFGTNQFVTLKIDPVKIGTNVVAGLTFITNAPAPEGGGQKLMFVDGPGGPFMFAIHMAFFGGIILASPFILYYLGEFIMPALKIREKKYFMRAFIFGTVLFIGGVCFAYFGVMPAAIKFAVLYADWMGIDVPFWPANEYASFMIKFMLGMGAGFELPVVLLALVKIGILDYQKLKAMRRYMIVGNLVLGAVLTTPEVLTQICMAVALQILFEMAVWIAWYWERQEKKRGQV